MNGTITLPNGKEFSVIANDSYNDASGVLFCVIKTAPGCARQALVATKATGVKLKDIDVKKVPQISDQDAEVKVKGLKDAVLFLTKEGARIAKGIHPNSAEDYEMNASGIYHTPNGDVTANGGRFIEPTEVAMWLSWYDRDNAWLGKHYNTSMDEGKVEKEF